jgi:hypothetical protein
VDSSPLDPGFPGFSEQFFPKTKSSLVSRAIPGFGIPSPSPTPSPEPAGAGGISTIGGKDPLKVRLWSPPAVGSSPVYLRLSRDAHLLLMLVLESSSGVETFEAFQMDPGSTRGGDHEILVPPRPGSGAGSAGKRRLVAIASDEALDPALATTGKKATAPGSLDQAWIAHLEERARAGHQAALDQLELP